MTQRAHDQRKGGRPRLEDGPKMPQATVDRLLVEGEVVVGDDGTERRSWPSQRDLARRFNVAPSLVAAFAKRHACGERRAAFQAGKPVQWLPPHELEHRPETPASFATPAPAGVAVGESAPAPAMGHPKRKPGRPRKSEAPVVSHEELDRLLVFGE